MKSNDVFSYMETCISKKEKLGKDSTAELYHAVFVRLQGFWKKSTLHWSRVTGEVVDEFQAHLQEEGLQTNTVNSYLSNFRAMYNDAVKHGIATHVAPVNPFAHLQLKREKTDKRATSQKITERIIRMDDKGSPMRRLAIDCYTFCFLACGIPFVDLANLTEKNIHGDVLVYSRVKTGTRVCIGISKGMRILIDKYRRKGSLHLFPLLPNKKKVSHKDYKKIQRQINEQLKKIGEELGQKMKLTYYVARHTWASQAHEMDIPLAAISQALGHRSEGTTLIYLAELSQEKLNKSYEMVSMSVDNLVCGRA
jgi:integrase